MKSVKPQNMVNQTCKQWTNGSQTDTLKINLKTRIKIAYTASQNFPHLL